MNPSHFEMPFFSEARKRTIISLCTEIPRRTDAACCVSPVAVATGME
jgi:hypothetical protein